MGRRVSGLLAAFLILCNGCAASASPADDPAGQPSGTDIFYRPFACDLFRAAGSSGGNLVLSPHSIAMLMTMAREGAAGETARQMDTVLRFPFYPPAFYRLFAEVLDFTPPAPKIAILGEKEGEPQGETPGDPGPVLHAVPDHAEYKLTIANGFFGQQGHRFADAFRRRMMEDFAADLLEVDFAHPSEARIAINRWAEGKTDGRIREIVPADLLTRESRMVLANAIYFKASWDRPFAEARTMEGPFRVAKGRVVTAKRMRQTEQMKYGETPEARLLELPYRRGNTAMFIVLPRADDGLDTLVKSMTPGKIQEWSTLTVKREVSLELPKFAFSSTVELSRTLAELGMTDAFAREKADFSRITAEEPLFIEALLHKGLVAVDEKGTEAAAVAFGVVTLGGVSTKPVRFVVDHPFLFLIVQRGTGAILFMGRVVDPTAT